MPKEIRKPVDVTLEVILAFFAANTHLERNLLV
jgi:hypothetical protein